MAAKKRRRRRSTARRHTTRRRRRSTTVMYAANPKHRRRRRHYRRNPGFSVNSLVNRGKDAAIGAGAVVGGELATRYIRGMILNPATYPPGSTIASAAELAIGTALGLVSEKMLGRQVARDLTVGAYAGVARSLVKQLAPTGIGSILSGEGPRIIPPGHRRRLNGYVPRQGLAGYASDSGESEVDGIGY